MTSGASGSWVLTARGRITKLTGSDDEYWLRVGDCRVRFIRKDSVVRLLPRLPRLSTAA